MTEVHVSMFYLKGTRGHYLADALLAKAPRTAAGSRSSTAPSVQIVERLRAAARAGLIRLYDSRWDLDEDGWNEVRTHGKHVLVKGRYGNNPRAASWYGRAHRTGWAAR